MIRYIVMKINIDNQNSDKTIDTEIGQSSTYPGVAYMHILEDYKEDECAHYEIWQAKDNDHGIRSLVVEVFAGEIESMLLIMRRIK